MNNFKLTKLSELVARVKVGFVGPINDYYCEKENGVPLIRTTDIDELGINYSNLKYVTKEFHQKNKKSQIKKGDLIIARHGENGKANVFKEDFSAQVLNAVIIEPDQNKLDSNLLKYYFDSPFIKKQILGVVKGSVQGVINTSHITDVLIPINEDINYKGLSKLINNLDTKIELNNRINAELEAMAKTLYDYWFVQFDFPDKNGKPYKTSGGKMEWNTVLKREIPAHWNDGELKDIANITMGQSPPGESYNDAGDGMIFFQGCTDFGNRYPSVRQFTSAPTRFAKEGDILLSVRAPVGTLNIAKEDCCIGRGLAALNSKDNCISYLFGVMVSLKQIFDRRNVDGTTFGSITKDDLFSLKVIKPDKETLKSYHAIVNPAFQKQNKIELENLKLKELRNWLLPMLMNGQVKVKD